MDVVIVKYNLILIFYLTFAGGWYDIDSNKIIMDGIYICEKSSCLKNEFS